jgi:hypothetical protein
VITILRSGMLGIMGLFFIAISLRLYLTKRPFLFPARWFMGIVILTVSSSMMSSLIDLIGDKIDRDYIDWAGMSDLLLLGIMSIILFIFFFIIFITMNGYMAIGVTEESIRTALHSALERLNLPFRESISRFQLTTIGADLQASMRDWLGIADIKINKRRHRSTLKSIAQATNEHFAAVPGEMNKRGALLYGGIGLLQVVLTIFLLILHGDRRAYSTEYTEIDKYREPERIVGKLNWIIHEVATGKTIDEGAKELHLKDITVKRLIVKETTYEGRLHFQQSIRLNKGFYLERLVYPQADRSVFKWFTLDIDHRTRATFCDGGFEIDGEHHATKSEGPGEMAFDIGQFDSGWAVTRTEFLSDVSFRMNLLEESKAKAPENYPKWRVTILKGSLVNWPSVKDDTVVPTN